MTKKNFIVLFVLLLIFLIFLGLGCFPKKEKIKEAKKEEKVISEEKKTELGSAKDWYKIAEEKAKTWQSDAILTLAKAENVDISIDVYEVQALFSGKTLSWKYDFFSESIKKPYFVTVAKGKVTDAFQGELIGLFPDQYQGLKSISEWKIDSTKAVDIAKEELKKKYNLTEFDPKEKAAYTLFNSRISEVAGGKLVTTPQMFWEIVWGGYAGHDQYTVKIDATNGAVLKVSKLGE